MNHLTQLRTGAPNLNPTSASMMVTVLERPIFTGFWPLYCLSYYVPWFQPCLFGFCPLLAMAQPMVTVEGVAPLAPGGTSNPSECDAWQCDSVTVWQCVGRRPDFQIFDKELTCSWGLTHNILSSPVKFRVNFSPNSPSPHTAQHGTVRHTLLCAEKPTYTYKLPVISWTIG